MSRMERLLEILMRLQTLHSFTVQELADEFGVSRRTMQRDLQALSEIGIPLCATPGPHGGYTLLQKQRLPSLSLTEDEAIAIILSYEAFQDYADAPFSVQNLSAITKLRAALPPSLVEQIETIRKRIVIANAERRYRAPFLAHILHAAVDAAHLRITYSTHTRPEERLIYPYGLFVCDGYWFCACFDYKEQRHIALRADHITALQREEGHERPIAMTLQEWLQVEDTANIPMLRLRASITERGMSNVDCRFFGTYLMLDSEGNAHIDMLIPETTVADYAHFFSMLGIEAFVESPPEMVAELQHTFRDVLQKYEQLET